MFHSWERAKMLRVGRIILERYWRVLNLRYSIHREYLLSRHWLTKLLIWERSTVLWKLLRWMIVPLWATPFEDSWLGNLEDLNCEMSIPVVSE